MHIILMPSMSGDPNTISVDIFWFCCVVLVGVTANEDPNGESPIPIPLILQMIRSPSAVQLIFATPLMVTFKDSGIYAIYVAQ